MPRFYNAKDAPATPQQGDLRYNEDDNTLETYSGSAWGTITFGAVTAGALTAAATTVDSLTVSAGFASTNSTGPAFYIPTVTGAATGAVASLGGRAPIVYNTTGRALMIRQGGSWFTTVSLALA